MRFKTKLGNKKQYYMEMMMTIKVIKKPKQIKKIALKI